jgi:hypothetical protein
MSVIETLTQRNEAFASSRFSADLFLAVLKHIVKDIEPGREYTEKQINALLERRHPDPASLRRGMIDFRLMERKSGVYWRV